MYCNNCGKKGHMYKDCRLPVTSCGNIIYRELRKPISRATDQTEDIKVIVEF